MCAEGDHGLVQEDQGELRRVCCCAAHISDVRIKYILYARDVIHASACAIATVTWAYCVIAPLMCTIFP